MPNATRPHHDDSQRSLNVFPAGCGNGEFNLPADLVRVIAKGDGCELETTAGDKMIDFSLGWGSAMVGHARPEIVAAIQQQATRGSNFAYVNEPALELAEEIVRVSPACDQIRFCASGTEATMYCLRLARAATGKPVVLRFEGAYHGAHDTGVTSLFPFNPPDFPEPAVTSAGITDRAAADIIVAPFNDLETTAQIISDHADQLAGIIVEPLQRCVAPRPGFLAGLRKLASQYQLVLMFDEVVTGFRLAYGGAQEYYDVVPDLVAYGKALGGGMPIGAFGGKREIMDLVSENRLYDGSTYVWTASTLGGNPISCASANAALKIFRQEGTYEQLHRIGSYLRAGIKETFDHRDIPVQILGDGPLAQFVFTTDEVYDYRSSRHQRTDIAGDLMLELFRRGIFLNPMGTKLYLSLAHTEAHCDQFCDLLGTSLDNLLQTRVPAVATAT